MTVVAIPAVCVLHESLWLDELHTSWCISGEVQDIPARASAGNQTPLFLWVEWVVCRTVGLLGPASSEGGGLRQGEWLLRLPSVASLAASSLLVYLLLLQASVRTPATLPVRFGYQAWMTAIAVMAWIGLDRTQLFFASEARVYGLLQLLSLVGWALVVVVYRCSARGHNVDGGTGKRLLYTLYGWVGISCVAINLHLLAGLSIAWQALCVCIAVKNAGFRFRVWASLGLLLCAGVAPVLSQVAPVWNRREQWDMFAGDTGWYHTLYLFPVLPLLVPVVIGRFCDRALGRHDDSSSVTTDRGTNGWLWGIAFLGPFATAWWMTYLDVTPIMHRRYLLVVALPMVVFCGIQWTRIRLQFLRWLTLATMVIALVAHEGTWQIWQTGQWVGWQRGEDWRGVAQYISERVDDDNEVWCASGLIEGVGAELPLSNQQNAYLSFPLRGIYQVQRKEAEVQRFVEPMALVGDASQWLRQWQSGGNRRVFVVARLSANDLSQLLQSLAAYTGQESTDIKLEVTRPPIAFGSIAVAQIRVLVN